MANGGTAMGTGEERRIAPRCSIVDTHLVPIDLAFQRGALLLDLSASGIGVQAPTQAPVGTSTDLHFQLPDSPAAIDGVGTVTWTDGSGRLGIRFDGLAALSRPHLTAWLSREQLSPPGSVPIFDNDEIALLRRDLLAQKIQGEAALSFVLARIHSVTGATGAAIAIENAGVFGCRASTGAAPAVGTALDPGSGLSGACVNTGEVVRCDDTETDARADPIVCRALRLRSAVIVPVKAQDGLIGVLEVFSSHAHAFESNDVLLLRDTAELIAELVRGEPPAAAPVPAPETAVAEAAVAETSGATVAPVARVPDTESDVALDSFVLAELLAAVKGEPELLPELTAPPRRLKVLLAALAATMLVGSGWAGWHWGQWQSVPRTPSPPQAITMPATTPAAAPYSSNVTPVSSPIANPAAPANRLPASPAPASAPPSKPISAPQKKVPVLVLPGPGPAPLAASASEPPPAIAPVNSAAEAAGLSAVLNTATAPASLAPTAASRGLTGGKLIRKLEPAYPPAARSMRLKGAVVLKASVDVNGRVGVVTVISGHPILAAAAVNAVKGWRYQPLLLNGVPVGSDITVTINFAPKD